MVDWRAKVSLGVVPIDHISADQQKAIRALGDLYDVTIEDICVTQELDSESELGWSNIGYLEIALPQTSLYVHIFTFRAAIESLCAEARYILGCDVSKGELERAHHWTHDFNRFGDGCAEYV